VGTEVVKIGALPVTALSCAANLFGGPAGIAALYVRSGTRMHPLFDGGIQEHGHRAGTENLLGIIGMGAAAADAEACLIARHGPRQARRDQLERQLTALIPDVRIFGQGASRLPGHSCFGIPGVDGEALVCGLDREGIALVQSSACMSQTLRASHVLRAMGVAESEAQQACLAVVDHVLTEAQVGQVAQSVARVANQLRAIQPLVSSGQNRSK
jgi:cysteine desulfurase